MNEVDGKLAIVDDGTDVVIPLIHGCGTLLLIASDMLSDTELAELRSFWMWEPLQERWDYIRDWEEHKREAMQRLQEYATARTGGLADGEQTRQPPTKWIQ